MTNTKLLRQKIDESGYKLSFIAEKLGLTYPGLQKKLNGESDFRQSEIVALADLLKLTQEEIMQIFFAKAVDKSSTI